jgi:hypothetical protein
VCCALPRLRLRGCNLQGPVRRQDLGHRPVPRSRSCRRRASQQKCPSQASNAPGGPNDVCRRSAPRHCRRPRVSHPHLATPIPGQSCSVLDRRRDCVAI